MAIGEIADLPKIKEHPKSNLTVWYWFVMVIYVRPLNAGLILTSLLVEYVGRPGGVESPKG